MILIFTEALSSTGMGHLGRCTALAEILVENGKLVRIILNTDNTFSNWQFPCEVSTINWLEKQKIEEIFTKTKIYQEEKINKIYIDSYLAKKSVYEYLYNQCDELICIDDTYRLEYPSGSTILNPGYPGLFINYDKTKFRVITGKNEVLLRKPFRESFELPKRNYPINKVLVTLGGSDPNLYSEKFLELLVNHFPELQKYIVIGQGFINEEKLNSLKDLNTHFYKDLSAIEMRKLMLKSDFAITAGGQTTYELDRCGVPMAIIKTAENQIGNLRGFAELQGIKIINDPKDIIGILKN